MNTNTIKTTETNLVPRNVYTAPQAIEMGDASQLVQGGGGMSGLDYLYYYWTDGNGN